MERKQAKVGRRPCRGPPNQRLDSCGARIGVTCGIEVAELLADAADPIKTVGIVGVDRNRLLEMLKRRLRFVELEAGPADPVPDLAVQRPLFGQLREQRLGDEKLPRGDQRLGQVAARGQMGGIELERLEVEGNCILCPAALEMDGAEIAPA